MTAKSFLKTLLRALHKKSYCKAPLRTLHCNGGHRVSIFITPARVCMHNKFSDSVTPVADPLRGDDK